MNELIHLAEVQENSQLVTLILRKLNPREYQWFRQEDGKEIPLDFKSTTINQAFYLARKAFKDQRFQPLNCGYRFTLPERDEHGNPALFYQMVKSLSSPNGIYYDDDLGHNCIVHQIPLETQRLYKRLLKEPS